MANKIVLGKRPKSFKRTVTFPMPGEDAGSMEVSYVYRTRSEFATFTDELQAAAKEDGKKELDRMTAALEAGNALPEPSQADFTKRQNAFNVRYLMSAVDGWNLDVPFDREAVEQLVDELPAAVSAIVADYRAALIEGRLGNSV
jgi:hypothetical protein